MESAIGGLIKKARERKGLTQTRAGKLLRFSEQFLGRIEAGEVPLPFIRARKVQEVLRIKRDMLAKAYIKDYVLKMTKELNGQPKKRSKPQTKKVVKVKAKKQKTKKR